MTVSQIRVLCRDKMMHTGEKQSGAGLNAAERIGSDLMKTQDSESKPRDFNFLAYRRT